MGVSTAHDHMLKAGTPVGHSWRVMETLGRDACYEVLRLRDMGAALS